MLPYYIEKPLMNIIEDYIETTKVDIYHALKNLM